MEWQTHHKRGMGGGSLQKSSAISTSRHASRRSRKERAHHRQLRLAVGLRLSDVALTRKLLPRRRCKGSIYHRVSRQGRCNSSYRRFAKFAGGIGKYIQISLPCVVISGIAIVRLQSAAVAIGNCNAVPGDHLRKIRGRLFCWDTISSPTPLVTIRLNIASGVFIFVLFV